MVDLILILGSTGSVGSQLYAYFIDLGLPVMTISAANLSLADDDEFSCKLNKIVSELRGFSSNLARLGIVLAHRVREIDISKALLNELRISRDLIWFLSKHFSLVNVAVLGSVTGRFIDKNMPDAYHLVKDMQKSCARLSVRLPNVAMNVLELSWFEKYPPHKASTEYSESLRNVKLEIGPAWLPTIGDIANFILLLLSADSPPRGQVITYDGGYSMLQR